MSRLLFNYGQTDITPEEPLRLAGYANRKGLSKEIHRRLTSRCVVIRQGEKILCLVVNDLMDVDPEIINSVKSDISGKTGIEEDSILIVSIHSHSAPEMGRGRYDANDRYIDLLKKNVTENTCSVINGEFREADIYSGKSECDINIARRDIKPDDGSMAYRVGDPGGLTDREVMVLQLKDKTGEKKVTLFNYTCHPVTLGYGSNYVSTDYPGRAREVVEGKYGGMAVFVNGATGDLNPRETDHTEPEVTDAEGDKLGRAVISAMLTRDMADPDMKLLSKTIHIPFRDQVITKEHIENEVRKKYSDVTEFFTWKEMLERWKEKVFEMIDRNETGEYLPFKINDLKLETSVMFFTQGELFVKYQIKLKKQFSGHNFIVNDFYKGIRPDISKKQEITISRITTLVLFVVASLIAILFVDNMVSWFLFINSVVIIFWLPLAYFRFFWPRFNVWGEMTATVLGLPLTILFWFILDFQNKPVWQGTGMLFLIAISVITLVTCITPAESDDTLKDFYLRCRPPAGWLKLRLKYPSLPAHDLSLRSQIIDCLLGIVACFGLAMETNAAFVGNWLIITSGDLCGIIFGGLLIKRSFSKRKNEVHPVNASV